MLSHVMMVRPLKMVTLVAAIAAMMASASCQEPNSVPSPLAIADAAAFFGAPLPPGASGIQAAGEAGIDRLVLLRFEASDEAAQAYAKSLVGSTTPGADPGLYDFGKGLDWWPTRAPPVFSGGERDVPGTRSTKVLLVPVGAGRSTLYVVAFTV
jgi:hypothetical protein